MHMFSTCFSLCFPFVSFFSAFLLFGPSSLQYYSRPAVCGRIKEWSWEDRVDTSKLWNFRHKEFKYNQSSDCFPPIAQTCRSRETTQSGIAFLRIYLKVAVLYRKIQPVPAL